MLLNKLRSCNPDIALYSCRDKHFEPYGRLLSPEDINGLSAAAGTMSPPESGSAYLPSVSGWSSLTAGLTDTVFGEMPAQTGYCWGRNDKLNALEWHKSSEINIALTPLVLLLGLYRDIRDNQYDAAEIEGFLLEPGDAVELYPMVLHFTPCEVSSDGFRCVVVLPEGTNLPLERTANDPLLFRKNKWLMAHSESSSLIARGVKAGIHGTNHRIKGCGE